VLSKMRVKNEIKKLFLSLDRYIFSIKKGKNVYYRKSIQN